MILAHERLFHPVRPGVASIVRAAIDPVIAVVTLAAAALWFGVGFGDAYLILAVLVFSMTFSSRAAVSNDAAFRETGIAVATAWATTVGVLLLLGWVSGTTELFDRRVIAVWLVTTLVLQLAAHGLLPIALARGAKRGTAKAAVIAGANEIGRRLAERIAADPTLGIRVAGFFDDRSLTRLGDVAPQQVLGSLRQLADFVRTHRVDLIYSALPISPQPRVLELLGDLRDTTASIYFVPDVLRFDLIQARVGTLGGVPVIGVCESPFYGLNALLKRCSDLVLSTAIVVLAAPLLLAIAVAVKAGSPGPVLFRQRRYGLDGKEFLVYKFRTMTCLEDGDVIKQAVRNDPRTTRVGAFLRRYSLDELPQFFNVLQGRMSVVGPRPHAVAHNEVYRKLIPGYMLRHKVKPGITGLAQVTGLRGETNSLDKMRARVECDLEYLREWSLALDVAIVLKTVGAVLRGDKAW